MMSLRRLNVDIILLCTFPYKLELVLTCKTKSLLPELKKTLNIYRTILHNFCIENENTYVFVESKMIFIEK